MTLSALKQAARLQGYFVFTYSESIIPRIVLGLYDTKALGKVFFDGTTHSIFLDDSLSEKAQTFVLAHELGHIALGHTTAERENNEAEADAFAMAVTGTSKDEALSA